MSHHPLAARQKGFTLIEIMVVVVIIGLLAAFVVPNVFSKLGEARVTAVKNDLQTYDTALASYRLDNYSYPTTQQGLKALVEKPDDPAIKWAHGPYMPRLKKDPWGHDYQYASPGQHGEYDLSSLGRDGQPGGEGEDADIGNWNATN